MIAHSFRRSVGGADTTPEAPQSEADKEAELSVYDGQVHVAQAAMVDHMTLELKALGVPFFGTHSDAIISVDASDAEHDASIRPKWSPRVTSEELVELQRRMISYLEDMYKV